MTGPQIRKARIAKGWTQVYLAKRLGCGQSTLSMIERGLLPLSPSIEKKLAGILVVAKTTKNHHAPKRSPQNHVNYHQGVVWHPNVHHYYGERLYYLLIRFARYAPYTPEEADRPMSPREGFHALLGNIGAFGHCIYEVFGDADLLVRVWLDTQRYSLLRDRLSRSREVIETQAFSCDAEDYLWAISEGRWRDLTDREIAARSKEIEYCSKQLSHGIPCQDVGGVRDLYNEGYILKFLNESIPTASQASNTTIKFFSFLDISPRALAASHVGRHATNRVMDSVRAMCEQEECRISDVSIYLGASRRLGNCLVKGTVKTADYYSAYGLVVDGLSLLDHEASPHTYLTASGLWHESDDLLSDPLTGDREAKAILAFVGVRLDEVGDLCLDDPKSKALIAAYDAIAPLFTIDDDNLLEQFVRGLLDDDQKAVRMGTSFLFDVEKLMVEYFRSRLAESYPGLNVRAFVGRKIGALRQEAKEAKAKGAKSAYFPPSALAEFTLKDYAVFLARSCSEKELADDLGADWQTNIERTIEIRNKMAHGRCGDLIGVRSKAPIRIGGE